ncbi:MAG: cobyric acid synthase, partial [Bryobacteraceae bacterium]
ISNLTDLQRLPQLDWIAWPSRRLYDCVILPGTKNTIADLQWMRSRGIDEWIKRQHAAGAIVVGICGGYQMLGRSIEDPSQVEGGDRYADGLGLLPVSTVLRPDKITRRVNAVLPSGTQFSAYEIHMGETTRPAGAIPFALTETGAEGIRHNRTVGTYLHGALEHTAVAVEVLGIEQCERPSKEADYDALADWFEAGADTRLFEEIYL